jgi:hypothetical protein
VPNVPSVESPATAEGAPVDPPAGSPYRAEQPARALPTESGGPQGPEPTRFGDWERNGRCIDF